MFRAAVVVLCGAGLAVSAAFAQQDTAPPPPDGQQQGPPPDGQMQGPPMGGHRGMNPERRLEMMQRRLNLSDAQTAQVRTIFSESRAKMDALRSDTSLTREDRRSQMMNLRQGEQAKVRAVLSPEQQAKYDAMMQRMRERRGEAAMQGGNPQPPPAASSDPQL
ncbi:MAG: Spy/CpxP family protein refolding chaperone [Acidobacteriaceae bacterium]